jgi:predicted NUDIX family phosphoesterase
MSLDSQILAIPRDASPAEWLPIENAVRPAPDAWRACLQTAHFLFAIRRDLETDETRKQPIPYLLVQNAAGELATYTRAGSEKRLHGLRSAGIGGHVEQTDTAAGTGTPSNVTITAAGAATPSALEQILHAALFRELSEEATLSLADKTVAPAFHFLGLINEEKTPVGRVHLGIVFLLKLGTGDTLAPRSELTNFQWLSPATLAKLPCEHWTTLALTLL